MICCKKKKKVYNIPNYDTLLTKRFLETTQVNFDYLHNFAYSEYKKSGNGFILIQFDSYGEFIEWLPIKSKKTIFWEINYIPIHSIHEYKDLFGKCDDGIKMTLNCDPKDVFTICLVVRQEIDFVIQFWSIGTE
jgi:hypothetical protein